VKRSCSLFLTLALGLAITGCSPVASSFSPSKADATFVKIVQDETKDAVKIFWAQKTLWVYLPAADREIYTIASNPQSTTQPERKFSLQYVDGQYTEDTFTLEYDVITPTKTTAGAGLSTQYTESFNTQYRNVLTAVTRAYFSSQEPPEFIVIVFADIAKGVEIQNTINAADLKKYFASTLAPEEYSVRVLSETKGSTDIIGDTQGRHLDIQPVAWPDFIIRQTAQRLRYKFQNSQFPPDDTPQAEVLKALATTTLIYDFKDFSSVVLKDLRTQTAKRFSRLDIEALQDRSILGEEKPPSEGEIITIDFSDIFKDQRSDEKPTE
jgi:hypothetical protein